MYISGSLLLIVNEIINHQTPVRKYIPTRKAKSDKLLVGGNLFYMTFIKGNKSRYKHGYYKHNLYKIWIGIKYRCYDSSGKHYHNYGGKGVIMCNEWLHNADKFIEWALAKGWKNGLQIDKDKIPFELGIEPLIYSPEMCSVLSRKENNLYKINNRRIEHNGEIKTVKEWSEILNVSYSALANRLLRHNTFNKKTLIKKDRDGIRIVYNGKSQTLPQWARELNIGYKVLYDRIHKHKMSLEKAFSEPVGFYKNSITHNGVTMNLSQWAKHLGIGQVTLYKRINVLNMSIDKAFTMPIQANKRNKR